MKVLSRRCRNRCWRLKRSWQERHHKKSYLAVGGFADQMRFKAIPTVLTSEIEAARLALQGLENVLSTAKDELSTAKRNAATTTPVAFITLAPIEHKYLEYTYHIDFFKEVKQDYTSIGQFDMIKDNTISFIAGAACWNGPKRRTKIELKCGRETQVVSVEETEKCVYGMVIKTPAACEEFPKGHVEL